MQSCAHVDPILTHLDVKWKASDNNTTILSSKEVVFSIAEAKSFVVARESILSYRIKTSSPSFFRTENAIECASC